MGPAWYRARAQLRRRALSTIAFGVVAGIAAGAVIAGVAGAHRTERAFDDMVAAFKAPSAVVFTDSAGGKTLVDEVDARLDALPEVTARGGIATALLAEPDPQNVDGYRGILAFSATDDHGYRDVQRPLVVRGRQSDPAAPNELVVNEEFAEIRNVDVGSTITLGLVPPDQIDAAGVGLPPTLEQPPEAYEVVGVVRKPGDLAPRLSGVEGTVDEGDTSVAFLTSAFWAEHRDEVASYGSGVVVALRRPDDIGAVRDALEGLRVQVQQDDGEGATIASTGRAVDLEARALLGAAALLGLIALVLIGQALRRQALEGAGSTAALRAIGVDRRGFASCGALEWLPVGFVASLVALVVALLLSGRAVIGIARRAAVGFGLTIDPVIVIPGCVAVLSLFVLGGALAGLRSARVVEIEERSTRTSRLGRLLAGTGVGPGVVIGARMAVEPGRGSTAVPVRSALTSAVVSVVAITAAATFAVSLDRVVEQPALRGWSWDYDVGNYSGPEDSSAGREQLLQNEGVRAVSGWQSDHIDVDGREISMLALDIDDGVVGPRALRGRLPRRADEVSLGGATLRSLGVDVGDTIDAVGPSGQPVPLHVVGETVGLGVFDDLVALDEGAVITFDGVREMLGPDADVEVYATGYLVRLVDGPTRDATVAQLREAFPGAVFGPRSTPDIENLRRIQWLPRLLVVGVGLMAIGTTAHALFSAARRRRRDLAVLKSVGFSRGQLASVTSAQASTYAVVALALGVPLGIALGRLLWGAAADQIGTFASASMPLAVLALAAAATIVLANLLALWPGRVAARVPAAIVLRTE